MNRTFFLHSAAVLVLLSSVAFTACMDEKLVDEGGKGTKNVLAFTVTDVQDAPEIGTRSLPSEVYEMHRIDFQQTAGLEVCLRETTVDGVNPIRHDVSTRAEIKTNIDGDFSISAIKNGATTPDFLYHAKVHFSGTLYTPTDWPTDAATLSFYALFPYEDDAQLSPATYSGTPYVDFTVKSSVTDQVDLMTVATGPISKPGENQTVPLTFKHALTAIKFAVGSNLSWEKTIAKIEIVGVYGKGRCTLGTNTWTNQNTPSVYTLDGLHISTSQAFNSELTNGDKLFLMVPQTCPAGSKVVVTFDDDTQITASLENRIWTPGTTKTYQISNPSTSNWEWKLTATSPAATVAFDQTQSGAYGITSYRQSGTKQEAVPWEVVGYSMDGGLNFSAEKPDWLTALSKENGEGGTAAETGTATLTVDIIDGVETRNNALKNATPRGTSGTEWDLSMHDIKGAVILQNTANCYVISAPGHYKLPLIYGNAVVNGATNESAYKTSKSSIYLLQNFKDHANTDIASPYINVQHSNDPATQAAIVWADESGLVTDLDVTGTGQDSYLVFEVPQSAIKQGNAVVAAKNADGIILWSWHLWFAPDDVLDATECINFQNVKYQFSKENIGWKYTEYVKTVYNTPRSVLVKVKQKYGTGTPAVFTVTQNPGNRKKGHNTFYQFGRKDAFPGTETGLNGSFVPNGGNNMSIQNGIQHPGTFYNEGNSWSNIYNRYNYWSTDNNDTGYNDNVVIKTVYDPSPVGFRMPPSNAFSGFTTNGQNNGPMNTSGAWNYGWDFNNKLSSPDAVVHFPASGYRNLYTGVSSGAGNFGYYWTAIPHRTSIYGCDLYFGSSFICSLYSNYRSLGLSVRPIAE